MKITKRTRTRELLPLMNDERLKEIVATVPPVPLPKRLLDMTVGEFIEAMQEDYILRFLTRRRAVKAFGLYRQFLDEMKALTRYIETMKVEQSTDEKRAAQGVRFPSFGERILIDCVRFYNLHSTEEAERVPLTDWLLMTKNESASAHYQRNYEKIMNEKTKRHNGIKR